MPCPPHTDSDLSYPRCIFVTLGIPRITDLCHGHDRSESVWRHGCVRPLLPEADDDHVDRHHIVGGFPALFQMVGMVPFFVGISTFPGIVAHLWYSRRFPGFPASSRKSVGKMWAKLIDFGQGLRRYRVCRRRGGPDANSGSGERDSIRERPIAAWPHARRGVCEPWRGCPASCRTPRLSFPGKYRIVGIWPILGRCRPFVGVSGKQTSEYASE